MGARISDRIAAIAESATLAVDAKAKALKAAGRPVIGFGAGEPDFPTPDYIVEAAVAAARDPKNHRYTPVAGLPELRAAIAAKTKRDTGYDVDAAQVLVTNGGKQAVYNAFATLLDPGDEVLLIAPYWTTYPEAIKLAGGVPVEVITDETSGYLATVEQLDAARTDRTKVLLFVSPSNPTGAVYPPAQVQAIGAWAKRARPVGRHRRDLRAPGLRRRADGEHRAHRRREGRRAQRRRQDLRDDRLAGGLADRPDRRRQGRREPAVARDVQRLERGAGGGAGRGVRRSVGGGRDAQGLRPAPAQRSWPRCPTSPASSAPSRRARSTSTRR